MRERIVGREAELQRVGALLEDDAPTASALVLTGEAGVGKTTIWEKGVALAGERGLRVLAARLDGGAVGSSDAPRRSCNESLTHRPVRNRD